MIELALERRRLAERLLDVVLRLAQLAAQLFERRALFLERVEARLRLQRLRRELLHGFAVLLQLPVLPDRLLRRLLRLAGGILQHADALVDLVEVARPIVERAEPLGDVVETRRDAGRLVADLLQRFADGRQLRAARRQGGEHGAQRAPFLARRGDEQLEFSALLLHELALAAGDVLEGVQHGILRKAWQDCGPAKALRIV